MILETKLHPPSLKPHTLRRERLLKVLKNNLERRLILISGDAGYGKTTLLVQVIEEVHLPCVYYDLDRGDNDFVVFFSYLLRGIERLAPRMVRRTKGLLKHGESLGRSYELAMGTLINELVEKRREELFFLLDDYHILREDSLVHKALDYFIDHLPDTVHVMIASRTVPPLPSLAKWRAKQDVIELTKEGLRCTEEEVKALLAEVSQAALSEEELRRVAEQTEGWITGIQLILRSLGMDGRTVKETLKGYLEARQPLFEYFSREVVASEPPRIQDFLKRSAILDVLTSQDCGGVLGIKGSDELLSELERRHLFISNLGRGQYKYHRLFREFLLRGFKPEEAKSLHLRAAAFYQKKRQPEQVIEHYLEAGAFEEAGRVIARVAYRTVEQARWAALKGWMERIPEAVSGKLPHLLAIQGRLCIEEGNLAEAEALCLRAESDLRKNKLRKEEDRLALTDALYQHGGLLWQKGAYREALKILGEGLAACPPREEKRRAEILNLIGTSWLDLGDYQKARSNLLRAKAAVEHFKSYYWGVVIEHNLATLLREQGDLKVVFTLDRSLIERIRGHYFLEVGIIFASAAANALDVGQAAWAEWCLNQGQALCRPYQDAISQAAIHRGYGALAMERAEWEPARQHLEKAREICEKAQCAIPILYLLLDLGRLSRYQGDRESARKYLILAQEQVGPGGNSMEAKLLAERGLLEAFHEEFDKCQQTARECLCLSRKLQRKREEFFAHIATTWALAGQGKEKESARSLEYAIRLARAKGYDGILARELCRSPLLRGAAARAVRGSGRGIIGTYLREVLRSCGGEGLEKPFPQKHALGVRLFGTIQLTLPNEKVVPLSWRSRKAASLFAYLLLHQGQVCDREDLIAVLWPRAGLKQAEQSLYTCVSQLKKGLASGFRLAGAWSLGGHQILEHQDRGYRIPASLGFKVDAVELLSRWNEARSLEKEGRFEDSEKAFRACATLYQGPFLAPQGERWCEERRDEYEKIYLSCLRKLALLRMEKQDYDEAIRLYRRYLSLEPVSEEVRVELWRALKASGRKVDIRKDYKELQQILRRDFGEEPEDKTREAFREIMQ